MSHASANYQMIPRFNQLRFDYERADGCCYTKLPLVPFEAHRRHLSARCLQPFKAGA